MVRLYTTHCPMCKALERKLAEKNIQYEECTNVQEMIDKNFLSVPILEVDGKYLVFSKAIKWVNEQ